MCQEDQRWFAIRVVQDRSYVLKYLEVFGFKTSRISDIRNLVFVNCTQNRIEKLRLEMYDKAVFYRTPDRTAVEAIPERIMKTFLLLAPFHDQPVFYMAVDNPSFFKGSLKRVTAGPFAGCEGVIKRVKGDRRLVIRLSDRAAVITPYIHPSILEDVAPL